MLFTFNTLLVEAVEVVEELTTIKQVENLRGQLVVQADMCPT